MESLGEVHVAVDVVHKVEPNHFHTQGLFADELPPKNLKVVAIVIDVISKVNIAIPGDGGSVLLEGVGVCLTFGEKIRFSTGWCFKGRCFDPLFGSKTKLRVIRVKVSVKLIGSRKNGFENHGGEKKKNAEGC